MVFALATSKIRPLVTTKSQQLLNNQSKRHSIAHNISTHINIVLR